MNEANKWKESNRDDVTMSLFPLFYIVLFFVFSSSCLCPSLSHFSVLPCIHSMKALIKRNWPKHPSESETHDDDDDNDEDEEEAEVEVDHHEKKVTSFHGRDLHSLR